MMPRKRKIRVKRKLMITLKDTGNSVTEENTQPNLTKEKIR